MKRIVLLDDYQGVALDYGGWDRVPDEWQLVALEQHIADPEELVEALAEAEIVVAMRERTALPAEILARLPELKLLVTTGMANVAIDVAAAKRGGVTVCGTGMKGGATAELSWGLILALLRRIPTEDANMRAGKFQQGVRNCPHGLDAGTPCGGQKRDKKGRQPETQECPCRPQTGRFARDWPQKKRNHQQDWWDDELEQLHLKRIHTKTRTGKRARRTLAGTGSLSIY